MRPKRQNLEWPRYPEEGREAQDRRNDFRELVLMFTHRIIDGVDADPLEAEHPEVFRRLRELAHAYGW